MHVHAEEGEFLSYGDIGGVSHRREIIWCEQRWRKAFKIYSEKQTN